MSLDYWNPAVLSVSQTENRGIKKNKEVLPLEPFNCRIFLCTKPVMLNSSLILLLYYSLFPLQSEFCKLLQATHYPTKYDLINDVKLFRTINYRYMYSVANF